MKILTGAIVEHWMDKRRREHKSIICRGNYIRVPAEMFVKFQEIRNKGKKKKLSLIEQQRKWEKEHQESNIREHKNESK